MLRQPCLLTVCGRGPITQIFERDTEGGDFRRDHSRSLQCPARQNYCRSSRYFQSAHVLHFCPTRARLVMVKRKSKKRRKKPPGKRARATQPSPAITEVVSDIVRTLTDKKFGAKLDNKRTPPDKTEVDSIP